MLIKYDYKIPGSAFLLEKSPPVVVVCYDSEVAMTW